MPGYLFISIRTFVASSASVQVQGGADVVKHLEAEGGNPTIIHCIIRPGIEEEVTRR